MDPDLYDALMVSRGVTWDVPWYLGVAREAGGPVLELGAGTGRVLLPLLAAGVDAYGLERDPAMLAAGRAKLRERLGQGAGKRLLAGDMRSFDHPRRYRAVLMPYNCLAQLDGPRELRLVLGCAARHLAPGGLLAFDILVAQALPDDHPPFPWRNEERQLLRGGERVGFVEEGVFHPGARRHEVRYTWRLPGGEEATEEVALYQWVVPELETAMAAAGWEPAGPAEDESGQPFAASFGVYAARWRYNAAREGRS